MTPSKVRLSYDQQIAHRISALYKNDPNSYVFTDHFVAELKRVIDRVDNWLFSLAAIQIPIYVYLAASVSSYSPDLSLLGLKIPNTSGTKVFLLLASALIAFVSSMHHLSNSNRNIAVKAILRTKYGAEMMDIIKLGLPESLYVTFPAPLSIAGTIRIPGLTTADKIFAVSALVGVVGIVLTALFVQSMIWIDVYRTFGLHLNLYSIALVTAAALEISSLIVPMLRHQKQFYISPEASQVDFS